MTLADPPPKVIIITFFKNFFLKPSLRVKVNFDERIKIRSVQIDLTHLIKVKVIFCQNHQASKLEQGRSDGKICQGNFESLRVCHAERKYILHILVSTQIYIFSNYYFTSLNIYISEQGLQKKIKFHVIDEIWKSNFQLQHLFLFKTFFCVNLISGMFRLWR